MAYIQYTNLNHNLNSFIHNKFIPINVDSNFLYILNINFHYNFNNYYNNSDYL